MKKIDSVTYYFLGDLVERLGASELSVRRWIDSGKLKGTRHPVSGHRMVSQEALDEFLAKVNADPTHN